MTFIGPTPEAIAAMGNKLEARRRARASGVPVVPGGLEAVRTLEDARAQASDIGYPIMLKAAAGGGGKGMRVVRAPEDFETAVRLAQGEARAAFGDDSVYLERYVDAPRHVEVQVLGDGRGRVIALGERDCSVQRRHQKVVEETPATRLPDATRYAMWDAAVRVSEAVGYVNAGTVEFLVSGTSGEFFFLEMNTRLQVEHPITEWVTSTDLVAEQIRIAAGQGTTIDTERRVQPRGAAIECRVYSEDPFNGFRPSLGTIRRLRVPMGPGIRVDSGIAEGGEVPIHYDPLLAKMAVWAPTREAAIQRTLRALREWKIDGVRTNLPFFRGVMMHPDFARGEYDTRFLERNDPARLAEPPDERTWEIAALIAALAEDERRAFGTLQVAAVGSNHSHSRWRPAPQVRGA
jgi:acetyl/propionyl-CoA carboxylase alpha subunit